MTTIKHNKPGPKYNYKLKYRITWNIKGQYFYDVPINLYVFKHQLFVRQWSCFDLKESIWNDVCYQYISFLRWAGLGLFLLHTMEKECRYQLCLCKKNTREAFQLRMNILLRLSLFTIIWMMCNRRLRNTESESVVCVNDSVDFWKMNNQCLAFLDSCVMNNVDGGLMTQMASDSFYLTWINFNHGMDK